MCSLFFAFILISIVKNIFNNQFFFTNFVTLIYTLYIYENKIIQNRLWQFD